VKDSIDSDAINPGINGKKNSILKRNKQAATQEPRNDTYGNVIAGNKKHHKIKFADNMAKVSEVENWKDYNGEDVAGKGKCCEIF